MKSKFFAKIIIFISLILLIHAAIFFISYTSLLGGIAINVFGIKTIQKDIYFNGFRNIWQANPDCVKFDKSLIYIPKIGSCNFKNAEFDTILNFEKFGRKSEKDLPFLKNKKNGIAILGDSHTMGWGVNDEETFSSLLQNKLNKKVFNLGISSYATIRELLILQKLNLIKSIDTIVIQYSPNDINENYNFDFSIKDENSKKFKILTEIKNVNLFDKIKFISLRYKKSYRLLYLEVKNLILNNKNNLDFNNHYSILINTLKKFDELSGKKIIIFYIDKNTKFYNYPLGFDKELSNVQFVNISLDKNHFYVIDDHINKEGHKTVANQLLPYIN